MDREDEGLSPNYDLRVDQFESFDFKCDTPHGTQKEKAQQIEHGYGSSNSTASHRSD